MDHQFRKEDLQRLKQFRLIDDDFMSKCFEDNIECTELVLQIVLERNDLTVKTVHTQHQIKNLQGRSIILDIYAVDKNGKHYNIEIQKADKGAAVKRARYYSSIIDANLVAASEEYGELPETYIIFITENDIMKQGLPIYHYERVCLETQELFGDESHIIYVNGSYKDDSPLGILMHDFSCTNPAEMRYEQLANRVRYFKETEKGVATMCKIMEDLRNETEKETNIKTALKLLSLGKLSNEEIAASTNLSLEEIEKLAK